VYGTARLDDRTARLVVRTDGRTAPSLGAVVHVRGREGQVHAFHAETGERLD
jgi:multiple sugar transport system ATP-binding protein